MDSSLLPLVRKLTSVDPAPTHLSSSFDPNTATSCWRHAKVTICPSSLPLSYFYLSFFPSLFSSLSISRLLLIDIHSFIIHIHIHLHTHTHTHTPLSLSNHRQNTSVPPPPRFGHTACHVSSKVYVLGGGDKTLHADVFHVYHTRPSRWGSLLANGGVLLMY